MKLGEPDWKNERCRRCGRRPWGIQTPEWARPDAEEEAAWKRSTYRVESTRDGHTTTTLILCDGCVFMIVLEWQDLKQAQESVAWEKSKSGIKRAVSLLLEKINGSKL